MTGIAIQFVGEQGKGFVQTGEEEPSAILSLRFLEGVLQGRRSTLHRRQLHAHAKAVPVTHRIAEGRHVLAEEVLDLVVAVELPPHLRKGVDLDDHRFRPCITLPPVGEEQG